VTTHDNPQNARFDEARANQRHADAELADRVNLALAWNAAIPIGAVHASATKGWITLAGELTWDYQRRAAELIARHVPGVVGVTNGIAQSREASAAQIKARIATAFKQNAEIDASRVTVQTRDGEVTLRGSVHSAAARREAERAAMSAPGVILVDDRIVVAP
jgi:osmotically-inducible protein OsmY